MKLPEIELNGIVHFIDFRLGEIRPKDQPYKKPLEFKYLNEETKAKIRAIRFIETEYNYIAGLDD